MSGANPRAMRRLAVGLLVAVTLAAPAFAARARIGPVPARLGLDRFYAKHLSAKGLPIVASRAVSDAALHEAAALVDVMLDVQPDVRRALIDARIRVVVIGRTERTTDVPEHRDLGAFWDERARGLGATRERPVTSCGEENLLGLLEDRYKGESILIHELAHTIADIGVPAVDPTFTRRLKAIYRHARERGLWDGTYAATNHQEYWAEGVQSWFDANRAVVPSDGIHNHVATRAQLEDYDPWLASLIAEVFGERAWQWPRRGAHAP